MRNVARLEGTTWLRVPQMWLVKSMRFRDTWSALAAAFSKGRHAYGLNAWMRPPAALRDRKIVTQFATAAVTGLGLLGLTTTGVWFAGRLMHAESFTTAVEINVASRQRTLVERITSLATKLEEGSSQPALRSEVGACTEQLMRGHLALLTRNEAALRATAEEPSGCTSAASPWLFTDGSPKKRVAEFMTGGSDSLDHRLRRFAASAMVLSSVAVVDARARTQVGEIVSLGSAVLPEQIDEFVLSVQRNAEAATARWHFIGDVALVIVYLGLASFWTLLFRPMADAATMAFVDLAETNDALTAHKRELQLANEQLAVTAERFRNLSNLSADWYWRTDKDLRITEVSDGLIRSGIQPSALIGRRLQDMAARDQQKQPEPLPEAVAKHEAFRSHEFLLATQSANTQECWVSMSGEPVFSPAGDFLGYRGVGRDITQRRKAMQASAETAAKLEAFVEAAPVAIAMFDKDMRYIAYTHKWLEAYGFGTQNLLGRIHYDVFPGLPTSWKEVHRRCMAGAIERVPEDHITSPSGKKLIVRREIRPWYDASGRIGGIIIMNDDVTAAATAMRALHKSQERFRLLFDIAPVGLCLTEAANGNIVMASKALANMTGYSVADLKQRPLTSLLVGAPGDRPMPRDANDAMAPVEVTITQRSGKHVPAIYSELAFTDEHNQPFRLAALQDISWRKEHEDRLWRTAHIDSLTGLPNRILLNNRLAKLLDEPASAGGGAALCSIDIDDFKIVNDVIGHAGGDELLRTVAARVARHLGPGDLLARVGSDEFALMLDGVADEAELAKTIASLRADLAEPFTFDGAVYPFTVSVGSAIGPQDGTTAEALATSADIALNRAKSSGRGSYVHYEPRLREALQKRVRVRTEIMAALERDEMALFYQPIVETRTGKHAGFEALIRWVDPSRGIITPGGFHEALEDTRSAAAIGRFVCEAAFAQAAAWLAADQPFGKISINLSTADFRDGKLVERLMTASEAHAVPPSAIGLEITENVLLDAGTEDIRRSLSALRDFGFEIAFDDFGTGHASLTHVRQFPIDRIKIDRSFVSSMTTDDGDRAIVCAMIGMAHGLGLRVTAEGVEEQATLELLGSLGCHEAQGYLLARPMPAADVPIWVAGRQQEAKARSNGRPAASHAEAI